MNTTLHTQFDGRALNKRPTTRTMTRRIQEERDYTTPIKDILLYIFEEA